MAARGSYRGFVSDSEDEDIMSFNTSAKATNAVAGPSALAAPPRGEHTEGDTISSIQTPDFTDIQSTRPPQTLVQPPKPVDPTAASIIHTADFTVDRSMVSNISSFGPTTRPTVSSIETPQSLSKPANTSISTATSASSAQRQKPRPRPAYKKKDTTAAADTSLSTTSSSMPGPSSAAVPPPLPRNRFVEPMGAPSHIPPTSSTSMTTASKSSTSGKERVSDSGVEMADPDFLYSHDIAERAKLRSRARTQSKAKAKQSDVRMEEDDVIELSSSEDDISFLPPAKSKTKPKPKPKKATAGPSSDKDARSGSGGFQEKEKGKSKDPNGGPPSKRTKTTNTTDPGFESDVNTIPVPTSDFPVPPHIPGLHSSQLPPSDPPPSSATSSSARTHPRTSQDRDAPGGAALQRDISPLSSPPPPLPRKRKRPNLAIVEIAEVDREDGMDVDSVPAKPPVKGKPAANDPPVPSPSIVPETQPPPKPKPAPRKKRKDPAEDQDEEWAGDVPAKPSKSRKKARVTDDDDFAGGGGGDGDDDDDWGASNGRGKAKGKKAAKKAPAKEKKGKAKAKEPEKAPKSKEVIEDSDEEGDRSMMPPPPVPAPTSRRKGAPSSSDGPQADKDAAPSAPASNGDEADPAAPSSRKGGAKPRAKGKQRAVVHSDEEDEDETNAADVSTNSVSADVDSPAAPAAKKGGRKSSGGEQSSDKETKENEAPAPPTSSSSSSIPPPKPITTPSPSVRSTLSHAHRSYTISAKSTKHTPMSELIRRASAQPGSPFPTTARPTYSPLAKASKSALRRIAPLHPHRRTPPPAPPRPPPPKKSKKMLELEEKWEMELEESVEGWYAMSEEERAALRRAKRDAEMGFYED
ncbi:hypothetical protein OH77DRAFT_1419373 [Trametes cingulata]|nr:hypothetical protein OH77DRAFT_1419373 [Trametes cingulata]